MSRLSAALQDYLAIRRAVGFRLKLVGWVLTRFVAYADQIGAETVTTDLAVAWATQPVDASPVWWKFRITAVRGFAKHLQTLDPLTEIPPADAVSAPKCRAAPYFYSEAETLRLMEEAAALLPAFRGVTYQTLIGLLAVTGMRMGEAMRLEREDVDWEHGVLTIRLSKFGKSRQVPVHPSTLSALRIYDQARDRLCSRPRATTNLFVSIRGTRLLGPNVDRNLPPGGGKSRPPSSLGPLPAAASRSPPQLRHPHPPGLVSRRPGCAGHVAAAFHLPRPHQPCQHVLVPLRGTGITRSGRPTFGTSLGGGAMSSLAPTLQAFFTQRLAHQRQASAHTMAAYRDCFRLLLEFLHRQTGKAPACLGIEDLNAEVIGAFLEHLESDRGNGGRTRNARLAALHSFFRFTSFRHPEHAQNSQRVLAIPSKRCNRSIVTFLTQPETQALITAPDRAQWIGRRDHALMLVAVQTGLRVSELTHLVCQDVHLGAGAYVRCRGKGRKERCTPLTTPVLDVLRVWLLERQGQPSDPVFPTSRGRILSTDAVEFLIRKYAAVARTKCPSLAERTVTPHVLRHTCAMRLLEAGVDTSVIALWLGHEMVETTQIYLQANLAIKERALQRTAPLDTAPGRYRPSDPVLAFLESL